MRLNWLLLVASDVVLASGTALRLRSGGGGAAQPAALRLRGGELAPSLPLITTEGELDDALEEAGSKLVVVDFYAEWCAPCKSLAPTLESLSRQAGDKVRFYKVDVDQGKELAASRGVKSMPTLQFFRSGQQVHEIVGGNKALLRAYVSKATAHPLVSALRNERILVAAAVAYLLFPWQRVLQA